MSHHSLIIKLSLSIVLLTTISSLAYGASTLESQDLIQEWSILTQNQDNPITSLEKFKWLQVGALLDMDAYRKTRSDMDYQNDDVYKHRAKHDIILSHVKLNLGLSLNNWNQLRIGGYYSDNQKGIDLEEAYWMFSNFQKSPLYLMVGKQFLPFGQYRRYPLLPTLTQQLSTANYVTAQMGYLNNHGIYIAPYAFHGEHRGNGGFTAGYRLKTTSTIFDMGLNYLYNWLDINPIAHHGHDSDSSRRVSSLAAHIDLLTGPFDEHLSYVTTLQECPEEIFSYQDTPHHIIGAKPRAGLFKMGYSFQIENYPSKISVGYQFSRQAYDANNSHYALRLPRNRFNATYGMRLDKPLIIEVEVARDQDYSTQHSATGRFDYLGFLRVTFVYD